MRYILIRQECESWWKSLREPSVIELMAFVESLSGVEFVSFHYVWGTDELDVDGAFNGYRFKIFMEWGGAISLAFEEEVPDHLGSQLKERVQSYKYVGRRRAKLAAERFQKLAKSVN